MFYIYSFTPELFYWHNYFIFKKIMEQYLKQKFLIKKWKHNLQKITKKLSVLKKVDILNIRKHVPYLLLAFNSAFILNVSFERKNKEKHLFELKITHNIYHSN